MTPSVVISDTAIAAAGISVARKLCRKMYTTSITSSSASISVFSTLHIEASRKSFFDSRSSIASPGGRLLRSSSTSLSMRLIISLAFDPAVWLIMMFTPG